MLGSELARLLLGQYRQGISYKYVLYYICKRMEAQLSGCFIQKHVSRTKVLKHVYQIT
jgi:hypothetical protein